MKGLSLLLGVLGGLGPDSVPPLRTDPVDVVVADLERWVPSVLARDRIPGMAVALIRDGRVAWLGGFGVRNSLTREPVSAVTIFPAASLGKSAASHTALRLASRGEIALDQPLASSLPAPWLGDDSPVTLRQVLAHTSGLSNFLGDRKRRSRFTPGERFEYSGVGFMYLQYVLEHRRGASLDSVVWRETFRPLGMQRAWFGTGAPGNDDVADGHVPLGRVVAPFGIVFLPLWLAAVAAASVIRRVMRGRWRPTSVILAGTAALAAACTTAFLYSQAANPRLVPYFVLTFAHFAAASVGLGRLLGAGRLRPLRTPITAAVAAGIFALARFFPLPAPHGTPPGGNAASSLRASAGDLALLAIELGRPRLLDSTLAREMLADQSRAAEHLWWGLGVGVQRASGADAVFHWGRNPSARGALVFYPDAGTGVVVLANGGTAGDAVAEVALRAIGGPPYWADE
jgi:CubicO group peptidase (beta-lactamase class C family)